MMSPTASSSTGTATTRIHDRVGSSLIAKIDAADREDGRRDQDRAGDEHEHLHLLHVVRGAGDERRGAELGDLPLGEVADPGEDRRAQVAAERHRHARAEVDGDDGADDLPEGDREHDPADLQDVGGVARRDALVDDVGLEAGQKQRGDRLGGLEDDHPQDQEPVGPQVADQEFAEHGVRS